MEAGIGYSIDNLTYAEAMQLYCEKSRTEWNHTAFLAYMTAEVNRDSKKGPKLTPAEFNPWESNNKKGKGGIPLAGEGFQQLKHLATSWQSGR